MEATATETRQPPMPPEVKLAIGRILRMGARPSQPGDIETFEKCVAIIMDAADEHGLIVERTSIGSHRSGWNFGNIVID